MAVNINVPSQVKTYTDLAAFPASGALKTIYIAEDTNKTYRWTGSVYVEVSASSTGITIGTTAITSGTVGRVLFEGTGNVVQESANLFWDNTNGTLEATTTADNFFGLRLKSITGQLRIKPYLNPTYGVLLESKTANASANLPLTLSGSRLLLADGNVLINTTTDAGYKLDVNGTARVQGNTTITKTGSALSVAFSSQTAQNSFFTVLNGTDGLQFTSRGSVATGNMGLPANSAEILCFNKSALGLILHTTAYLAIGTHTNERMRLVGSTGNVLINTTTDAGFKLDVNGTARVQGGLTSTNSITADFTAGFLLSGGVAALKRDTTGYLKTLLDCGYDGGLRIRPYSAGFTSYVDIRSDTSAALTITSTNQGFLPPRLTTTQKNAIASPATGLMVYDNILNRPCFYDGTTWITL